MLKSIDWTKPWYRSVCSVAKSLQADEDWRVALNAHSRLRLLSNHRGLPLQFVDQALLPENRAYESFISATGCVPGRNNLHDFFNAAMWLSFPATKQALNAVQAGEIESRGIGNARGPARDIATLFDENGALIVVRHDETGKQLVNALRNKDWQMLFVAGREAFTRHADVWLFGHALLEKMCNPYKAITAHAWIIQSVDNYRAMALDTQRTWLDNTVAEQLSGLTAGVNARSCFAPIPLAGIPGWWPRQEPTFYADRHVFRPARAHAVEL